MSNFITVFLIPNSFKVLKILNSNVESPYLIWDNSTRAELTEFVDSERTSSIRRGVCDPAFGSEFKFSAHKGELVVGNIFVRIYNHQPMFQLEVFVSAGNLVSGKRHLLVV